MNAQFNRKGTSDCPWKTKMQKDAERCRKMQKEAERCRKIQKDAERCRKVQLEEACNEEIEFTNGLAQSRVGH